MEMADYWLLNKDLVPKLFKVIVPRYEDDFGPYTIVHKLGERYPGRGIKKIVIELKDNPLPPINTPYGSSYFKNSLTNLLINAYKNDKK
jgi:large subunit ribosomal protein L17